VVLRILIQSVEDAQMGLWTTKLTPGEVRRLGDAKASLGTRSVIGLEGPEFDGAAKSLSVSPDKIVVLNVGSLDDTVLVDLGQLDAPRSADWLHRVDDEPKGTTTGGDQAFLEDCMRLLNPTLATIAERLLVEIRRCYRGQLHEGTQRRWVNYPGNFVVMAIQNRDQSLAVYVKGRPEEFDAPTLDIRPDRQGYSRFKVQTETHFFDALRVILASARRSEGY